MSHNMVSRETGNTVDPRIQLLYRHRHHDQAGFNEYDDDGNDCGYHDVDDFQWKPYRTTVAKKYCILFLEKDEIDCTGQLLCHSWS